MIKYPQNWNQIGTIPKIDDLRKEILQSVWMLNCNNLSLSGGIDSSFLLWCLVQIFGTDVNCFTITLNDQHPDYFYSKLITDYYNVKWTVFIPPEVPKDLENDNPGDGIVRYFYAQLLDLGVGTIIAGDGIDEFMGGYYKHNESPTHQTYYDFMTRLQKEQLEPLHKNSGSIDVVLPYMSPKLLDLYNEFPMDQRFDSTHRKKLMIELSKNILPDDILYRHKYGFVDAMRIK